MLLVFNSNKHKMISSASKIQLCVKRICAVATSESVSEFCGTRCISRSFSPCIKLNLHDFDLKGSM